MALFGATLTLPGMAGNVLTIGMAVDANVIINERIRELLRQGMPMAQAIEHGYENAMSAILDSNITSILTSILLYVYGTGPIKGFAISTAIGISVSMLTAILGTHGIYDLLRSRIEKVTIPLCGLALRGVTNGIFSQHKVYDFMKVSPSSLLRHFRLL